MDRETRSYVSSLLESQLGIALQAGISSDSTGSTKENASQWSYYPFSSKRSLALASTSLDSSARTTMPDGGLGLFFTTKSFCRFRIAHPLSGIKMEGTMKNNSLYHLPHQRTTRSAKLLLSYPQFHGLRSWSCVASDFNSDLQPFISRRDTAWARNDR